MKFKTQLSARIAPVGKSALETAARTASTVKEAVAFCIQAGLPKRFLLMDERHHTVSIHAPAKDGASGPLGHLGLCLGSIIPA